ncbi:MAG TPA: hypothetical protein VMB50_00120 [Myxococcales bacterium]|nr:hypothetical protein [Myxococcales bacterium]
MNNSLFVTLPWIPPAGSCDAGFATCEAHCAGDSCTKSKNQFLCA